MYPKIIDTLKSISYMTKEQRLDVMEKFAIDNKINMAWQRSDQATNLVFNAEHLYRPHMTLMAHYDIIPGSCGANDNGSSVAILMNLASQIKNKNIIIVFTDREETGGYGCRQYINGDRFTNLIVNLDVCGFGDDIVICDETDINNMWAFGLRDKMKKHNVYETDNIPYCDSRTAERMKKDVWSICVFPHSDAIELEKVRMSPSDKMKIRRHNQRIPIYKYPLPAMDIMKSMHNGSLDDIKYINPEAMEKVYNYLLDAI